MEPNRNLANQQLDATRDKLIETEIYFLICKFLSLGPCSRTAQAIREEIEENQLLPLAYNYEGHQRRLTLSQYERNFPHIRNDHLIQICSRIGPILDSTIPSSVPGIRSLLGAGTQSLLRTSSVIKSSNLSHLLYRRHHGAPLLPSSNKAASNPGNIVNILSARESSGSYAVNRTLSTSMYSKQQMHKRYLGHLSSVYCVAFDRTGKYIFTGADDHLVKIWSAISGRLLATLRGHSSEITDLAVNFENTLLASGSCDRIIRVWSLRTTEPITILAGHTATITSLKFCPYSITDNRFLISTSNDGCVNIWRWNATTIQFDSKPIKFVEKRFKANAQILCSSFSPGGSFLAVGSTDHFVRVYHLSHRDGPQRIWETDVNSDQVDSIQFSNYGLKFISGSKDGTAHIWWFERQTWCRRLLDMSEVLQPTTSSVETEGRQNKIKVNMVCWTCDDAHVITAVNDRSIKVWEANTGKLKHVLRQHEDEVFVLEANPVDGRIFLSGGHDGRIIIWDVNLGVSVAVFCNQIEGQGPGSIFDCKFSPDGQMIASTDSHGHLAIYGYGTRDRYERVPNDVFFHTDYRPLIRDANHYVIDEQTQCAPHLMPPPFLVDIDGNPYPPNLQRLVPGRENCKEDQLVPYIAIHNERGVAEVLQPVVGPGQELLPQARQPQPTPPPPQPTPPPSQLQPQPRPPFQLAFPPQFQPQPLFNQREFLQQQLIRPIPELAPQPEPQPSPSQNRLPTIDDMIERLAQEQARERVNVEHGYAAPSSINGDDHGPQRARSLSQSLHQGPSSLRNGARAAQEGQGVRQPGANWQSRDKMSTTPLGGRIVVENLRPGLLNRMLSSFRLSTRAEEEIYTQETKKQKMQEVQIQTPPKAKDTVKPKQKKKVVRRSQDANRSTVGNAESSALSQNRGGSSVSNDLENAEDLVSLDESDSSFSASYVASESESSTGESESDSDSEGEDDDDDDESGNDEERGSEIVTRSTRNRTRRTKSKPESWEQACLQMLEDIWTHNDSVPFRHPVDLAVYPDYLRYVDSPMDLSTIREELNCGNYATIHDFIKDMETMFLNSRKYNTEKKSQIYQMTIRLRQLFREKVKEISNKVMRRSHRSTRKNDSRYTLRNKRQRKENNKYQDFVTTNHTRKKRSKLKRKNGERTKRSNRPSAASTGSSGSGSPSFSPSTSFDPSQPSTSGLSSRVTSQNEQKKGKKTRRRVIRPDDDDEEEVEKSVPSSSVSSVNGLANGVKNNEFFKTLVQSEDEETDIEETKTNGFNHNSGSDTEIDNNKQDTSATEIADDDETQDTPANGPCESKPALPRKRRKVRKSIAANRKRLKTVNGSVNGGSKVRLKSIKQEPVNIKSENNDTSSQVQINSKSELASDNAEDICAVCNLNAPPAVANDQPNDAPIDWISCDTCTQWFHLQCANVQEKPNEDDPYCCDLCAKVGEINGNVRSKK